MDVDIFLTKNQTTSDSQTAGKGNNRIASRGGLYEGASTTMVGGLTRCQLPAAPGETASAVNSGSDENLRPSRFEPFVLRGGSMVKTFRNLSFLLSALIFGGLAVAVPANVMAQQQLAPGLSALTPVGPFLLRFDENGNATITVGAGQPTTLPGLVLPDPTSPVGAAPLFALTYMLPEPVIAGDVSFAEPGGGISDWLRFTDAAGHLTGATTASPRMLFYSDLEPNETNPDLADRIFPANLGSGNFLAQLEVGSEGNNGFDYRPGGVPFPQNNEYIGISDAVPEPENYTLMLVGLGLLGFIARHRTRNTV